MHSNWKTHRGDEWWYLKNAIEATGTLHPTFFDFTINDIGKLITEKEVFGLISETEKTFPGCCDISGGKFRSFRSP